MLNEPLIIIALGTGLMLGAAQVRKWRTTETRTTPVTRDEKETSRA